MPLMYGVDSQGRYVKWGKSGKKYHYTTEESKRKAKEKALKQAAAIQAQKKDGAKERQEATKQKIKTSGKKPKSKPSKIIYPKHLEASYSVALRKFIRPLFENTTKYILPRLSDIKKEYERDMRLDAYGDSIIRVIDETRLISERDMTDLSASQLALEFAVKDEKANARQMDRHFKSVLGINPIIAEPWLRAKRSAFVVRNVGLIKSIPEQYFKDVQTIIMNGVESGISTKKMAAMIRERYGVTNRRATLIASDQIGKYFGELTKARQMQVGATKFRWRTSRDERVRREHAARNGKIYTWKNGDNGEFPGQPIRCRCVAEMVVDFI